MPNSIQSLRYRDLAYVALNVSNLDKSCWFYEEMVGLTPNGRTVREAYFRCSDRHHDILLIQSPTPGLKRIGWRMESREDCAFAREHMAALGLDPHDVSTEEALALGISDDAFRVREPTTGAVMEFFSAMEAAGADFVPTVAKIERLGHIVLGADDLPAAEAFCINQLNFRVSDRVGDIITFFRCFPNVLHHSFALSKSDANALHHVNFMVTEVDDIGKAANRFKRHDVPVTFGPGRHPTSDSMFFYFADPDGHWLEYSFGMEEIHEHDARDARQFPLALQSIDTWGGRPDRAYPQVGPIDSGY